MPNTKDTNPKDAIGTRKLAFSNLPWRAMAGPILAMLEGSLKYGRHNYRPAGVRASVYFDACFRHMTAWWEGENVDPHSGLHHVDKAIASLLVLRDSMLHGNWGDDRPPRVRSGWIEHSNAVAKRMIGEVPDPKPPFTDAPLPPDHSARLMEGLPYVVPGPPVKLPQVRWSDYAKEAGA